MIRQCCPEHVHMGLARVMQDLQETTSGGNSVALVRGVPQVGTNLVVTNYERCNYCNEPAIFRIDPKN